MTDEVPSSYAGERAAQLNRWASGLKGIAATAMVGVLLSACSVTKEADPGTIPATPLEPDSVVFQHELSCSAAVEAEMRHGSEPQVDMKRALTLNVPAVFKRTFLGRPASVVYMCNGGIVQSRLIYVQFDSRNSAQESFDAYSGLLTKQFGEPCRSTVSTSESHDGDEASQSDTVQERRSRIEWMPRNDAITNLEYQPRAEGQQFVLIETYEEAIANAATPGDVVAVQRHGGTKCKPSN